MKNHYVSYVTKVRIHHQEEYNICSKYYNKCGFSIFLKAYCEGVTP